MSESLGWLTMDADLLGLLLLVLIGVPVLLIAVLAFVELLVLLALLPFVVLVRVLLGRHWVVQARRGSTPWWEEASGDWRTSGTRVAEVAAAIGRGAVPEQTVDRPREPDAGGEPQPGGA